MRSLRARRLAVTAWVAISTSGCVAWRVESVAPRELLKNPDVHAVRVIRPDNSKVEIYDPSIVGDSISGHPTARAVGRLYVPLSHVQTIESQHKSFGKTVLLGLAVIGAVGAYALLQSLNPPGY